MSEEIKKEVPAEEAAEKAEETVVTDEAAAPEEPKYEAMTLTAVFRLQMLSLLTAE